MLINLIAIFFCLFSYFIAVDSINYFQCLHENKQQNWITIDNKTCYYVSSSTERADWHEAENRCITKKAQLVSIHDTNENKLINNLTIASKKYWIGLNSLEKRGAFVWSDGTSRDYNNFDYGKSVDPNMTGRCVYTEGKTGIWKYNYCNDDKIGFICSKSDFQNNSNTKNQKPVTLSGNCPNGWYRFENKKCVKIINQLVTQSQAKSRCSTLGGEMLSIDSSNEQNFITAITADKPSLWIGLNYVESISKWSWMDDSKVTFTNWDQLYPKGINNKCVVLMNNTLDAGQWRNVFCNETFGFICQTTKSENSSPSTQPFKVCNISDYELGETNFISYRNSCYIFVDRIHFEWTAAQLECQKINGSNLVSVLDPYEYAFLRYYTQQHFNSSQFWIGFYANQNSSHLLFRWTDEWPVYYTYWNDKQPLFDYTTNRACVYQDRDAGKWSVDSCMKKKSFICKSTQNPLTHPESNSSSYCPEYNSANDNLSWIDLDITSKFCYWFSADVDFSISKTTWAEASLQCRLRGGTLASIHSYYELLLLREKFNKSRDNTWIGLYESNNGYLSWEDSSPVDFTNWYNKIPVINDDEYCASVMQKSLYWTNSPCMSLSHRYNYVCQVNKILSIRSTTKQTHKTGENLTTTNGIIEATKVSKLMISTQYEYELTKGAKVGFVILAFVIFGSIVINVYFLSQKYHFQLFNRKTKPQTHNPSTSRSRTNDILNSQDPKVVFSNIKLK